MKKYTLIFLALTAFWQLGLSQIYTCSDDPGPFDVSAEFGTVSCGNTGDFLTVELIVSDFTSCSGNLILTDLPDDVSINGMEIDNNSILFWNEGGLFGSFDLSIPSVDCADVTIGLDFQGFYGCGRDTCDVNVVLSVPTGACCMPDGSCTVTTEGDCIAGTYQGDGVPCAAILTYYLDVDGDGYPVGGPVDYSCPPTGYRLASDLSQPITTDCDDTTDTITIPGSSCDDGNEYTGGDIYDENCTCVGGFVIPTLSQWGIIVLSMIMLIFGLVFVRKRKRDGLVAS